MRSIPILLLLFIFNGTFAQTPIEIADRRDQIVRYERVIVASDSSWIFAGMHQAWSPARTLLVCRNDAGEIIWELPNAGSTDPWNMAATSDGFVYTGPDLFCSLPTPQHTIVRRLHDGELLWTFQLGSVLPLSMDVANDLIAMIGNDYELGQPVQVLILDGAGGEHSQWVLPWQEPRAIHWSAEGQVLTLFNDLLARWSDQGIQLQNEMISPGALDLAVIAAEDIRVLYGDRVVRFASDLTAIDSVMLSGISPARWMEFANDTLWITCEEGFVSIHPVDGLFTTFSDQPIDSLTINGTAVRNGIIMTAGTSSMDERSSGVMRSYTTAGDTADHDVDVRISIGNVDTMFIDVPIPSVPNMLFLNAQFSLLVENNGSSVLDQLLLNTQRTAGFCGADFGGNVQLEDLQLAPGTSTLVQMPLIEYWPMDVPVGEVLQHEVCFVALAPNDLVDRDPIDNITCHQFDLLHTRITDHEINDVVIAPMPFTEHFSIQLSTPPGIGSHISIHDAVGKALIELPWPSGRATMKIDAVDLPVGMLLLKLKDADRNFSRRIMHMK